MEIEILSYKYNPCRKKLACILIQYEKIVLRCDLVYHVPTKKAWLRMPEIWKSKTHKHKFCWWPNKKISDEFQEIALQKLFEKYDLSFLKIERMHTEIKTRPGGVRKL